MPSHAFPTTLTPQRLSLAWVCPPPVRADLNPWLAGTNGLALVFVVAAFLPPLVSSLPQAKQPPPPDAIAVVVESTASASGATLNPPAVSPLEAASGKADPAPTPEPAASPGPSPWREMPELIAPRPIVEPPPPRPIPAPPGGTRRPLPIRATVPAPVPPARAAPGADPAPANQGKTRPAAGSGPTGVPRSMGSGKGPARGNTPDPPYPIQAKRNNIQGTLELFLTVMNGRVASVRLVRSSGSPLLDGPALSFIQRVWKWPPGTDDQFTRKITFRLK